MKQSGNGEMKYQAIFWDLDGTLVDSGPGIMKSVQYALDHFGYPGQPEEKLRRFVGPALMDSFTQLYDLSEQQAKEAIHYYREMYDGGEKFDAIVYEGIPEVLAYLAQQGSDCMLVTSKPEYFAGQITAHFHIDSYFSYIASPSLTDPSSQKARLINRALADRHLKREEVIMIGDTHFDIDGAVQTGVASIGVLYGYGSSRELSDAGADFLAERPLDILDIINGKSGNH